MTTDLLPIGPHDHPEPRTMTWTQVELAAIRGYAARCVAAERERLAADIKVLALAAGVVSAALDELVGACLDGDGKPMAPDRGALMRARSMLPPTCEHALKKAPAGEKT
jgi:hypothetical protein